MNHTELVLNLTGVGMTVQRTRLTMGGPSSMSHWSLGNEFFTHVDFIWRGGCSRQHFQKKTSISHRGRHVEFGVIECEGASHLLYQLHPLKPKHPYPHSQQSISSTPWPCRLVWTRSMENPGYHHRFRYLFHSRFSNTTNTSASTILRNQRK